MFNVKSLIYLPHFIHLLSATTISCPNIVFDEQPTDLQATLSTKEREIQNCGGHPQSQTNFILHENNAGKQPYLSASITFEHYNTENICFEELVTFGDKEYQTEAVIIKLVKDVHTAPVHNYAKRATDMTFTFQDEYRGLDINLKPKKARRLAETLCSKLAGQMKTVQAWGNVELCGYWNSRYLVAGAACTMPNSYIELVELTGASPQIAVTYQVTTINNITDTHNKKELVTLSNHRNQDHPGHLQLRTVDFVDSGSLYPHPFSIKSHVIRGSEWFEFIDGKMNKIDEQNTQKAFWASYGKNGRNKLKNNFAFKPFVTTGNSISATCDYATNLNELAVSATDKLTMDPGVSDFKIRPFFNRTDKTVRAEGHRSMRIRPTFEIRLPIIKTITRHGIVGDFECRNIPRNGTFYDDEVLACKVTQVLRPGIISFHVVYNCEIIATRKIDLSIVDDLQFDIPVAVYNRTMQGAVCSQYGDCVELAIGRNSNRKRVYREKRDQAIPQHSTDQRKKTNGSWSWFGRGCHQISQFFQGLFSIPWQRYLLIAIVALSGIFLAVIMVKCGCFGLIRGCFRCGGCQRRRRPHQGTSKKRDDIINAQEESQKRHERRRTSPPPILHPKPVLVYLTK